MVISAVFIFAGFALFRGLREQ
nr:hypothetical protein [Sicyoidochytrium minutum DNA virus]